LFYEDDRVLYISLHRCDKYTFFPYNKECKPQFVGTGKGQGFNVNVAWETGLVVDEEKRDVNTISDLGNNEYRNACDNLLYPIVKEF